MKYPCIFRGPAMKPYRDHIQTFWKQKYGKDAPFAYLQRTWRERHCATLNPYGSEDCPYAGNDCLVAFAQVVTDATHWDNPKGRFYHAARSSAAIRADNKPLARDRIGTDVTQRPSDSSPSRPGHQPGPDAGLGGGPDARTGDVAPAMAEASREGNLRRSRRGLVPVDEVLRALDLGPRQSPTKDGKESPKR